MKHLRLVSVGVVDREIVDLILARVGDFLGFEVSQSIMQLDPASTFDSTRQQYSSVAVMRELVRTRPPDATRLLALTEKDLFIPMLSFVYGQAQLNGEVAIVSLARLRQEFYGLPPNPRLTASRAIKESFHEIGHTLGLVHCVERDCPMSLSTNITQLDRKTADFCRSCTVLLEESLNRLGG